MPIDMILGEKRYLWDIARVIFWLLGAILFFYIKYRDNVSYLDAFKYLVGIKRTRQDVYTVLLLVLMFGSVLGLVLYGNLTRHDI